MSIRSMFTNIVITCILLVVSLPAVAQNNLVDKE